LNPATTLSGKDFPEYNPYLSEKPFRSALFRVQHSGRVGNYKPLSIIIFLDS
jgi:hypothetical protein